MDGICCNLFIDSIAFGLARLTYESKANVRCIESVTRADKSRSNAVCAGVERNYDLFFHCNSYGFGVHE